MAELTAEELKSLLTQGLDKHPEVLNLVPLWIRAYSGENQTAQYLKVRRAILRHIADEYKDKVAIASGIDRISLQQKFDHVMTLLSQINGELGIEDGLTGPGRVWSQAPQTYLPSIEAIHLKYWKGVPVDPETPV